LRKVDKSDKNMFAIFYIKIMVSRNRKLKPVQTAFFIRKCNKKILEVTMILAPIFKQHGNNPNNKK